MSEHWIIAAEQYARRNPKLGLSPENIRDFIAFVHELRKFVTSEEGTAAGVLLAASDKFIEIVRTTRRSGEVVYGWGFRGPMTAIFGVVGIGRLLTKVDLFDFAYIMLKDGKTVADTLTFIRAELDKIGAAAFDTVSQLQE
jgi:hypothetical protein